MLCPCTAITKEDRDCRETSECSECTKCRYRPVDIIFVLDGSSSVSTQSWNKITTFVLDFLDNTKDVYKPPNDPFPKITIENRGMRVAVVVFGDQVQTVFNFTDLERDGDDYGRIRRFRNLSAVCNAINDEQDCISNDECRYRNFAGSARCIMQGVQVQNQLTQDVDCVEYDEDQCGRMIACAASVCSERSTDCTEGEFLCVPYVPSDLLREMREALGAFTRTGGNTRTHLAIDKATQIFRDSELSMGERNRLLNLVPAAGEFGDWRDVSGSRQNSRDWDPDGADQQRVVVLVKPSPFPLPVPVCLLVSVEPTALISTAI